MTDDVIDAGPAPRLIVSYNTRCPVCDAGIDWQRNKLLAAVRVGHISFRDIDEEPDALAAHGASLNDVRHRLHATDRDLAGNAERGLAGIAIWQSGDAAGHALCL